MIKIIGITGGIGCGKSTLINIFKKKKNILVLNTDNIAKDLMLPNKECYNKIVKYFSSDILDDKKAIDSKKLSSVVMNDSKKLKKLNKIVHPAVIKYVKEEIDKHKNNHKDTYDYIVIESALLLETKLKKLCDEIWNIYADLDVRIHRLCTYRNYTKEQAMMIIRNQKDERYYSNNSTRTFINNTEDGKSLENMLNMIL